MSNRIDHFMYAVPSLDDGRVWAQETFGTEPAYGGEHIGLGTRNALLSLGECYLELIAPDPAQSLDGTLGERLANLQHGGLITWAVQGELSRIAATLAQQAVETVGPVRTQRRTSDGKLLVWELLFPRGSAHGTRLPFFIDWLDCPHPGRTSPEGGLFRSLHINTPDVQGLSGILSALDIRGSVDVSGDRGGPALTVVVESRLGPVTLASTPETSTMTLR